MFGLKSEILSFQKAIESNIGFPLDFFFVIRVLEFFIHPEKSDFLLSFF